MGIDIGYSGRFLDRLQVDFSVANLGFINWKKNTKTYRSKDSFTFEGVELSEYFSTDTFFLTSLIDSLKESFRPDETAGSYRSTLSPDIFAGGHFSLSERTKVGLFVQARIFDGIKTAVSFYAQHRLMKILEAGLSYTFKGNSYDHVGINLGLKFGPFRIDLFTDELINLIRTDRARYANFRIGLTVVK